MKKYNDKRVCVIDFGLHVELALRLAKDFGTVDYFMNWVEDVPRSNRRNIGTGFASINRIYELTDSYIDTVDLFVFPRILNGTLQIDLEKRGKRVWGSRDAELLEIDRKGFVEFQKKVGLPIPKTEYATGVDDLRKKVGKDGVKFVKSDSNTRGDMETFKVDDREIAEQFDFKPLETSLGHNAKDKEFIIQDAIDGAIAEIGFDGFCIDGKYPDTALFGVEAKDKGYVGGVRAFKDLPKSIQFTLGKIAPALKAYGIKGWLATDIQDTGDDKGYFIDPTMRLPYPSGNVMMMAENLAEYIYEGAGGVLVEPIYKNKFYVDVIMYSDTAKDSEYYLKYPDSVSEFIHTPYCMMFDGKKITLPQDAKNCNVGSITVGGSSIDECIEKAKKIAKQVKGHELNIDFNPVYEAQKDFLKL